MQNGLIADDDGTQNNYFNKLTVVAISARQVVTVCEKRTKINLIDDAIEQKLL